MERAGSLKWRLELVMAGRGEARVFAGASVIGAMSVVVAVAVRLVDGAVSPWKASTAEALMRSCQRC